MSEADVLKLTRRDLACYALAVWPRFELAAHLLKIVDLLERVERGEILRLVIYAAPARENSFSHHNLCCMVLGKSS